MCHVLMGKEPADERDDCTRERKGLPAEWSPKRVIQVGSRGPGLELEEDPLPNAYLLWGPQ